MALLNLDFTNIETNKRMSAGTHTVIISSAEVKPASTGAQMLSITYKDEEGATAFDNFVILPQSLWKLKIFLEAVFNTPFTSKINLEPKSLLNKKLIITTEDEEYINSNGQPATRARVSTDYKAVSVASMMGVTPKTIETPKPVERPTPVQPTPVAPTQPTIPVLETPVEDVPTMPTETPTTSAPTNRPKLPWEM